jgi:hypothetical protein
MKYLQAVVIFLHFNQLVINAKVDTTLYISTGFQVHYGFIIPHSKSIRDVSYTNPYGAGISLCTFHTSFRDWQVFNAYWISGIEASYFNFQYPEVIGYCFALTAFAEPVISHGKKYLFTIRGGSGISYHNKIYDPVDNPMNMFFSSRISFPLYVAARLKYTLKDRNLITLSASYNHISNGGYKQPNKGMNFPTLALGLECFQKVRPLLDQNYSSIPEIWKSRMFLTVQTSMTERVITKEGEFPQKACLVYGLHARVSKTIGPIYALSAGAEIMADGYIKESLRRNQEGIDYKRFALTFGQNFILGKVNFAQYFGFYLYSPVKARNPVYQKYELSYRISNHFLFGVYLKAHAQVAESMGFTLNYQLFI